MKVIEHMFLEQVFDTGETCTAQLLAKVKVGSCNYLFGCTMQLSGG